MRPSALRSLEGTFVAEIGVGIVHTAEPAQSVAPPEGAIALSRRIKANFDPTGRLNPGRSVIAA
jgi:glycolate oxidase FAD binding subunit